MVRATAPWAFDHETELRTMLRLSLQPNGRIKTPAGSHEPARWIGAQLEGLPGISSAARDRLGAALVLLFGSDAVVWTTDIAKLRPDEAIELLAWMAQVLIAATSPTGNTPDDARFQ